MAFILAAIGICYASHEVCDKIVMPAGEKVIRGVEWVEEMPQRVKHHYALSQIKEKRAKRKKLTDSIRTKYTLEKK